MTSFSEKDNAVMVRRGTSLECPLEFQQDYITPVDRFFVCNSGTSPVIPIEGYSLRIHGDGVECEITFRYEDLLAMPQQQVSAVIECAGNHRAFFHEADGKQIQTPAGTEELIWSTGAVGMAHWGGVRFEHVLKLAGIKPQAVHVCATGSELDSIEGTIKLPLPVDKALHKDTLLALQMNSKTLSVDHGHPVRVLVPGWVGAYSIKWVQDIEVSCSRIQVRRNTQSYVLMGDSWPAEKYAPATGKPITQLNIKSALALPRPARVPGGLHCLHGYARSPGRKIASVVWSDNAGKTWSEARLVSNNEIYGWVKFEFDWHAQPGHHTLMTSATDESGESQPEKVPFNTAGYLYNAVHPHPVEVIGQG